MKHTSRRANYSHVRAVPFGSISVPLFITACITFLLFLHTNPAWCADVKLAWDTVSDSRVDLYEVQWGHTSGVYQGSQDASSNSAEVTGLQEGENYVFVVRACTDDHTLCSDFSDEVSIIPFDQPEANFTVIPSSGSAPLTVEFTNTSTGTIQSQEWRFGDGTSSTEMSPNHTYVSSGDYTVTLTVTGPGGSHTKTMDNVVSVLEPIGYPPVPDFTASPKSVWHPLEFIFTNTSTGDIDSWAWNFGDGGSSTEENPIHTYTVPGSYDVTLTVTGPGSSLPVTKVDHLLVTDELPIEFGEIVLNHEWGRIQFKRRFQDPVVIAKPPSHNGGDAVVVRIDAVDSEGFNIRLQEWDYLGGKHTTETVSYIVLENGRYQLPDGASIEAGWIEADHNFVSASFDAPMSETPVVITTVTTVNEETAVTTRLRDIDQYGFEVKLQEQEANANEHSTERVAYIAWEPSSGEIAGNSFEVGHTGDVVTHQAHSIGFATAFDLAPVFLADMQTTNDGDTANLRWNNKDTSSVDVWIDEEASQDTETDHPAEDIGYLALGPAGAELVVEVGEIDIDQQWQRVEFQQTFSDPIVVVGPLAANGSDAAVVRVGAVDRYGFEIRLQKWLDLDGIHDPATVNYLVMERGRHQLPNGTWVEADRRETRRTNQFDGYSFATSFASEPILLTTVATYNGTDPVTTRVRKIELGGFEMGLEEQEASDQNHTFETIAYVAWEPSLGELDGFQFEVGRTGDEVRHKAHTLYYSVPTSTKPIFLANMQTTDGKDTANLCWENKSTVSVDVWIEEEQSRDTETRHTTEVVGYLIVDDAVDIPQ